MSVIKRPGQKDPLVSLFEDWRNPPMPKIAETNFPRPSMVNTLSHALGQCRSLNQSGGEFEIRFGIESKGRFQAGFKKEHFRKLASLLQEAADEVECKKSVDYFYPWNGSNDQHARFECSENSMTIIRVVLKTRQASFDFFGTSGMTYDFRAVLSNETVLAGVDQFPINRPIRRRNKMRAIYMFNDHPWRFELTTVKERTYETNQESTSYEVEIELDPAYLIRMSNTRFIQSQVTILQDLIKTYNKFDFVASQVKSSSSVPTSPSSMLLPITNVQSKLVIKRQVSELMGLNPNQGKFPGAMPFALTRTSEKNISAASHVVTWKADGERFFLCIFPHSGVFLINRKYDIYDLKESHPQFANIVTSAFTDRREASSILDGEIILNRRTNKFDFIIFDMVVSNGAKTYCEPYTKRMGSARKMVENIRHHSDGATYASLTLHISIKDYHEISNLRVLRRDIQQTGPNSFMAKEAYDCDGVVFIPIGPYVPRQDRNMFKVKLSLEQITIDFEIAPLGKENDMDKRWGFYCMHEKQLLLCREQTMDAAQTQLCDSLLIQYEVERRSKSDLRLIVECYYDSDQGVWKVLKRRTDKNVPNAFSVYCETMETLVQGMVLDALFK